MMQPIHLHSQQSPGLRNHRCASSACATCSPAGLAAIARAGRGSSTSSRSIQAHSVSGLEDAASQAAQHIASSLPEQLEQLQVTFTHMPVEHLVEIIKGNLHVSEIAHNISSYLPSTLNLSHPDIAHLLGDSHVHHPTLGDPSRQLPSFLQVNAENASAAAATATIHAADAANHFLHTHLAQFLDQGVFVNKQQQLLQLSSTLAGDHAVQPFLTATAEVQQAVPPGSTLLGEADASSLSPATAPAAATAQTVTSPAVGAGHIPGDATAAASHAAAAYPPAHGFSDASDTVATTTAATAAALQYAAATLPSVASPVNALTSTFEAFSAFTNSKLSALAGTNPDIHQHLIQILQDLSSGVHKASVAEDASQLQAAMYALLVNLQQLVGMATDDNAGTAVSNGSSGSSSSVTAMMAAQEALQEMQAQLPFSGITQLSLVALLAAALPKDMKHATAAAKASRRPHCSKNSTGQSIAGVLDELPQVFDPDALTAYFSRRPMQVLQRAAEVMRKLSTFVAAILTDWKLGKWESNMPMRAEQAVSILESLGPAYIKIGQTLSTRVDMVPELYIQALTKLQDNVPPFSSEEARAAVEQGVKQPIGSIFSQFSKEPVAAASLGQVYKAQLQPHLGGGAVAVKVQRPGVLEAAALDIFVLRRAAQIFSKLPGMGEEWASVLDEWALRFFSELDYTQEAANTMAFKQHMASLDGIAVAAVHPDLTSRKVLVMSWLDGQKLSAVPPQEVRGLCTTLLNCSLIQLLETGLLHADPHPGNLMRSKDGKLIILDFGLMTEVTVEQRVALVEFIAHLTMEDWHGVLADMTALGFLPHGLPDGADVDQVAGLMQKILGQIVKGGGIGRGLNVFSLTHELEHVAKAYKVVVPPYFTLVLRAFCTIEGIALKADPSYSIVAECLPYLSHRLLSDSNPRMRAALHHLLYGDRKRLDLARLQKMMEAFGAFTTAGSTSQPMPAAHSRPAAGLPLQQHQRDNSLASWSFLLSSSRQQSNGRGTSSSSAQHDSCTAGRFQHSSNPCEAAAAAALGWTVANTSSTHDTNRATGQYGGSNSTNSSSAAAQDLAAGLSIVGSVLGLVLSGRPMDAAAAAALGLTSLATYPGRQPFQHGTHLDSTISSSGTNVLGSLGRNMVELPGLAALQGDAPAAVSPALKEALRLVFSPEGSYVQELLVDELVAGVDVLSREALIEALRLLAGSLGALGGLKGMLGTNQIRTALLPNMSLNEEDRQTLDNIKLLLSLLQNAALGNMGLAATPPAAAATSHPFGSSSSSSDAAISAAAGTFVGQQPPSKSSSGPLTVLRVAGELLPLVPELMPGIQATLEIFVRQLLRRIALRLAAELAAPPQGTGTAVGAATA